MPIKKRVPHYFILLVTSLLSSVTISEANDLMKTTKESKIIMETPYRSPFKDHDAFIKFMKKSKFANPPWSDKELRTSFSHELYESCFDQRQVQFSEVLYKSPNGVTKGWTIRPTSNKKELPVVVFNRGGFAKWGRVVPYELLSLCRVAKQGYMVVASDFRGIKDGAGKQDKTDIGYGDVNDSFYLVDALTQKHNDLDTDNMAVWGFSRGTTLAAMMATKSDSIRLVILQGMVSNLVNDARREEFDEHVYPLLVEGYDTLSESEKNKLLSGISPLSLLDQIVGKPSYLILHGALDTRTSAEEALIYASKLLKRKYSVEFHLYPNTGHVLSGNYNNYINNVINSLKQNL